MKNLQKIMGTVLAVLAVLAFSAFTACNDNDNDNSTAQGASRVKVHMTDAPGDYDAVNIEVVDVKVKSNLDANEEGWVSLGGVTPGIYNLLDLTGGVSVLLADHEIAAGHLGQIRLILGEHNTVVKNGVTYDLNTPSAQQSGLKLNIDQTLVAGVTYEFLVDFDVEHSIVEAGNSGNINLHPVLRVTPMAVSGAIKGHVAIDFPVLASVTVNGVEVTTYTDAEGNFYLHGVPAGTYTVTLTPALLSGLSVAVVQDVTVTTGAVTDVGLVAF